MQGAAALDGEDGNRVLLRSRICRSITLGFSRHRASDSARDQHRPPSSDHLSILQLASTTPEQWISTLTTSFVDLCLSEMAFRYVCIEKLDIFIDPVSSSSSWAVETIPPQPVEAVVNSGIFHLRGRSKSYHVMHVPGGAVDDEEASGHFNAIKVDYRTKTITLFDGLFRGERRNACWVLAPAHAHHHCIPLGADGNEQENARTAGPRFLASPDA